MDTNDFHDDIHDEFDTFPEGINHLQEKHGLTEASYYDYFNRAFATLQQLRYDHEYLHEVEEMDN